VTAKSDVATLAAYLGSHVSALLAIPPFSGWRATRSDDEDLPEREVRYEFGGHGVELLCDGAERIRTIFLHCGDGEALSEVAFSVSRREVLERFGVPSKSGAPVRLPVLGSKGAWDRFAIPAGSIHFQYRLDRDEIEMITLMCRGTEP
jgi:hypothetical protein